MNSEAQAVLIIIIITIFSILVILPIWVLGVVRIFLSVEGSAPSKTLPPLRYLVAWLLSFVAGATLLPGLLVGIIELFRQWKRYRTRRHMTKEQAEITDNISIWAEASKADILKLIYAYVILPAWVVLETSGNISSVYHKQGYEATASISFLAAMRLVVITYIPLIVPPTAIRFIFLKRGAYRGFKTYCYILLSLCISVALYFFLFGTVMYSFGILSALAVYCILSYRSDGYSEISRLSRYTLTILTMVVAFFVPSLTTVKVGKTITAYFPIWEAIVLCCALNTVRHEDNPEAPHPAPPPAHQPTPPDTPAELVSTALALIGRPTLHENEYLTPAMTQSRHEAERPFVKILSATYRTDTERKAMSRHFMLWKEFAVFVALSQVLKSDKALLAQTQSELKERLNEGLPSDVLKKRVEIMRAMSGIFTADYKISGSLEQSFLRTFRETLPDGLPELPDSESVGGYLVGIYRFIYGRLKREYQGLRERERV